MSKNLVEPGRYRGRVVDHEIGKAGTGTPQVAVQFEFTDKAGETRRMTWYGYFTTATISSEHGVLKQLRELGFDVEKEKWNLGLLGRKTAVNPGGGVLMGREADITIEKDKDKDNNETRKIEWINAEGGIGMKVRAETPEDIAAFIKEVRANAGGGTSAKPAAAQAAKTETAKPAATKEVAASPAKDDLPF